MKEDISVAGMTCAQQCDREVFIYMCFFSNIPPLAAPVSASLSSLAMAATKRGKAWLVMFASCDDQPPLASHPEPATLPT